VIPAEAPSPEVAEETSTQPSEGQEVWQTEDGTKGSKTDIDSIVSQMADLKCDSYSEEKSKDDFTDPIYSVKITGSKDYSLQIFAKDEEENNYPAVTSESPYVVFLPSWKAESLMKKAEVLVPKEDEGK
ncbi:MAG: hypothetical protein MUP98_07725, partial [Candidatus Aminicenantes bacterium]|nr:hypothetical protein [Candidatus Aminicenantes bacterium]